MIRNKFKFLLTTSICLALAGCSIFGSGNKSGEGADGALNENDLNASREDRFGSGSIPTAEGEGMFRDVRFDYDSYSLNDQGRQDIEFNVQVLQSHPDLKVQLEGHCDERGTRDYNMALGAHRAKAVRDMLASFGVAGSKLSTISYGAEIPLDPSHNESAWAKNRRVHFSAFGKNGEETSAAPAQEKGKMPKHY